MLANIFNCPHCDRLIDATQVEPGAKLNCPGCEKTITVPTVKREKKDQSLTYGRPENPFLIADFLRPILWMVFIPCLPISLFGTLLSGFSLFATGHSEFPGTLVSVTAGAMCLMLNSGIGLVVVDIYYELRRKGKA